MIHFFIVERTDMCNFKDDTTPNSRENNLKEALTNLEHDLAILVEWFVDHFMMLTLFPLKFSPLQISRL